MLRVRLFQNNQQRFAGTANRIVLPGEEGELSVMDFHAPMLCALTNGSVQIDDTVVAVRGGLARVDRNIVTIVAH